MTFAERLKSIRRQADMTQEQMAERLHVSRQAVTKWETGGGIPDIENLRAIARLFEISIDELLSGEAEAAGADDFLYESVTEYDVAEPKRFDIRMGGARQLVVTGSDAGKLKVRIASNTLAAVSDLYRVKIDDTRRRIDVDVLRADGVTDAESKEALSVYLSLPARFLDRVEITEQAQDVTVHRLVCEELEINGKSRTLTLDSFEGTLEMNCNMDLFIDCLTLDGDVQLNQISASSRIRLPREAAFDARTKGIHTALSYEESGRKAGSFATPDAEHSIELNGMNSELIICRADKE